MRPLLVATLLLGSAACDLSRSTRPDGTVIQVRLRDDQARPGGRNQIFVTPESGDRINASTGTDGVADISVRGAGVYQIHVIPRAGYLSAPDLITTVVVGENETTVVRLTLHLIGWNGDPVDGSGY